MPVNTIGFLVYVAMPIHISGLCNGSHHVDPCPRGIYSTDVSFTRYENRSETQRGGSGLLTHMHIRLRRLLPQPQMGLIVPGG